MLLPPSAHPTETSRQDCARAASDTDCAQLPGGSCVSEEQFQQRPWLAQLAYDGTQSIHNAQRASSQAHTPPSRCRVKKKGRFSQISCGGPLREVRDDTVQRGCGGTTTQSLTHSKTNESLLLTACVGYARAVCEPPAGVCVFPRSACRLMSGVPKRGLAASEQLIVHPTAGGPQHGGAPAAAGQPSAERQLLSPEDEFDVNDLFSLRKPKNALSGLSSGLQSIGKGATRKTGHRARVVAAAPACDGRAAHHGAGCGDGWRRMAARALSRRGSKNRFPGGAHACLPPPALCSTQRPDALLRASQAWSAASPRWSPPPCWARERRAASAS